MAFRGADGVPVHQPYAENGVTFLLRPLYTASAFAGLQSQGSSSIWSIAFMPSVSFFFLAATRSGPVAERVCGAKSQNHWLKLPIQS